MFDADRRPSLPLLRRHLAPAPPAYNNQQFNQQVKNPAAFTAGKRHPVVCINIYLYVNKSDFAYEFGDC